MEKKLCKIGAKISYIRNECDVLEIMINEVIHKLIDENPEEMKKIISELIKENVDELL